MNRNRLSTKALAGVAALCAAGVLAATPAYAAGDSPIGEYIVTLHQPGGLTDAKADAKADAARDLSTRFGGTLLRAYRNALDGFLVKLPSARAQALAKDPAVASVSPNRTGRLAACDPDPCQIQVPANSWGRDFLDGRTTTLDGLYHYDSGSNGFGVTVYVLDSGLGESFVPIDFGGRATWGPNFRAQNGHEYVDWPYTDSRDDCDGHGSAVAGVIGSNTWGVARMVTIKALRVATSCDDLFGDFYASDVIHAIDWIIDQQHSGSRSVINFSAAAGDGDANLDAAFTRALQAGIPVVTAAGNENTNSCDTASPQRVPGVINVGAHTQSTGRAAFSNYGPCVDLYAPGVSIKTTSQHNNQTDVRGGTSLAAPHVTGLVARYMQEWELFPPSPSTVQAALVNNTTSVSGVNAAHGSWFRQPEPACEVNDGNDTDTAIPATGSIDSAIVITGCYDDDGLAQYFVGKMRVSYALEHPRPSDVKIDLVSPGATPTIYPIRSVGQSLKTGIVEFDVINKPRLGTWKLRLTDTVSGQTGYLNRWFIGF